MDNKIGINETLKQKFQEYGIAIYENLRPKLQEDLIQIEKYIQKIESEQEQISEKIKEFSKLNLLSISTGANVQRSTIYNNPNTLKSYIEGRINDLEKKDSLGIKKLEKYKQKNKELNECHEGFQQRIVENHVLLSKINEMEDEIKDLNNQNESLLKQNKALMGEVSKLQMQLRKNSKEKVVNLHKNE